MKKESNFLKHEMQLKPNNFQHWPFDGTELFWEVPPGWKGWCWCSGPLTPLFTELWRIDPALPACCCGGGGCCCWARKKWNCKFGKSITKISSYKYFWLTRLKFPLFFKNNTHLELLPFLIQFEERRNLTIYHVRNDYKTDHQQHRVGGAKYSVSAIVVK